MTRTEGLLALIYVAIEQARGDWSTVDDLSVALERVGLSREQAASVLGTTAASVNVMVNRRKKQERSTR